MANGGFAAFLGHFDLIGQSRTADGSQIESDDSMRMYAQKSCHTLSRVELAGMALPVVKAQSVQPEALLFGDGGGGGGVDAAA